MKKLIIEDTLKAVRAAQEDADKHGFKKGKGGNATIVCPICKGNLAYSVASINGHLWGTCQTEGCVQWMQ